MIPWEKVKPVGARVRVVLEPLESLSSVLIVVNKDSDAESLAREHGIILEIGEGAFDANSPNPDSDIKVGDLAIFRQYAGMSFKNRDEKTIIRIMNDTEVWGRIDKEDLAKTGYDVSYAYSEEVKALNRSIEGVK